MLDLLITNGLVMDGSGNDGFWAAVGVEDNSVRLFRDDPSRLEAKRVIDAIQRVVCPGFIDMHAHSGLVMLAEPKHEPKVRQGVTTEVIGVDGNSYAPFRSQQASVHERRFNATPERLAALISDLGAIWPTQIAPAPRPEGELLRVPLMRWQDFARPGAVRAFRVVSPPEMRAEHWFEVERVQGGTLLRHTIDGEAFGAYERLWRDRIEPTHDLVLEALLDNVGRIVATEQPGEFGWEEGLPATS